LRQHLFHFRQQFVARERFLQIRCAGLLVRRHHVVAGAHNPRGGHELPGVLDEFAPRLFFLAGIWMDEVEIEQIGENHVLTNVSFHRLFI
jgi:hypothetical protein